MTEDEVALTSVVERPSKTETTDRSSILDDTVIARDRQIFGTIDLNQFMLNIGLLTQDGLDKLSQYRCAERQDKNHWRNLTYIPEVSANDR